MYEKYYGFSKEPFNLNLDPRFFFPTENFKEAWNSLIYGITNQKGFILVTGEKGIGKTTLIGLIHLYFAIKDPKIKIVPVFRPFFSLEEYIEEILRKLQSPVLRRSKSYMISQFNNFLIQKSSSGETLAILFDESVDIPADLRGLEYLKYADAYGLAIVLGQWLLDNVKEVDQSALNAEIDKKILQKYKRR